MLVKCFFLLYCQTCSTEQCLQCTKNPVAPIPTSQLTSMHPVNSIQIWQIAVPNVAWFIIISLGFLAIILVKVLIRIMPVSTALYQNYHSSADLVYKYMC